MTDLVERLRIMSNNVPTHEEYTIAVILDDAADRIEALEKERDALVKERDGLREALTIIEQGPARDRVSMTQEALIARAALGGEE